MSTPRLVIAHGYTATPRSHWFPWLSDALTGEVIVPALPASETPDDAAWIAALHPHLGELGPDTVLLGHSLGAITILRALAERDDDWSLGGLIVVSGFAEPLTNLPALDAFSAPELDIDALAARIDHRAVIVSDDDSIVSPLATLRLAARLDAPLTAVEGGGHFLGREGHDTLPAVLPLLERMLPGIVRDPSEQ